MPARAMACWTRSLTDSGCRARGPGLLPLADAAEHWAVGDAGGSQPVGEGGDGAPGRVAGAGEHDEVDLLASLVGLGPGEGQHQAVGVLGDLVDGQRGQFAAAQRGDKPDQQQSSFPNTAQVGLGRPEPASRPGLGGRAGVHGVEEVGGISGAARWGRAPWVRLMPSQTASQPVLYTRWVPAGRLRPAVGIGYSGVRRLRLEGEPSSWPAPAVGPDGEPWYGIHRVYPPVPELAGLR